MVFNEQNEFAQMLINIAVIYRHQINPNLLNLYWLVLQHYPWEEVVKAFELHLQDPDTGQFMPKPADIIRIIKGGGSQTQSLKAWTQVEQAIRIIGPYSSVVFDDAIIHAVLQEMGGWIKMCSTAAKELPFVAKEFQTRYTAYRYKAPSSYPGYFVGLTEHQNTQQGFNRESLRLLGDQEKAKAVLNLAYANVTKLNVVTTSESSTELETIAKGIRPWNPFSRQSPGKQ